MPDATKRTTGRRWTAWIALAPLILPATAVAQGPPDRPDLRWLYFYEQRSYPFARTPPAALARAYRTYRAGRPDLFAPRPSGGPGVQAEGDDVVWRAIGPDNIAGRDAGRVAALAIDPRNPDILYAGAAQGGVWRSVNAGVTWTPMSDRECSLAIGALAVDPVEATIIYAGTGELNFSADSYYGCGVLRSTDAGATWTTLGTGEFDSNSGGARISKLLIDPATAGSTTATTVYAATSVGIWRSTTSGATWTRLLDGIASDLVMDPSTPTTLYASIGSPAGGSANGIYRSADGGTSWTKLAGGLPTDEVGRIALAIARSAPAILYAAIQDAFGGAGGSGSLLGIWKTTDAGSTWGRLPSAVPSCGTQCWYNLVVGVDPSNADIVYFGGVSLYRSVNGGTTFGNVLNGIHVDQHAFAFHPADPSTFYAGNDGGVYRTTNRGLTWTPLNANLAITQFYGGVAPHPGDPGVVIGGTQDNGTVQFSGDPSWSTVLGGDGGFTAFDHSDPTTAYAETQWSAGSNFSGPRKRSGNGFFSDLKVSGINLNDRASFIPPFVMHPTEPELLYFGTFRVYRSVDGAESWSAISPDLSRSGGSISAIGPAPSDPQTIYAGTNDGSLRITTDGGANWTVRTTGLPVRAVTDIAVDASDPRIAVLSVSGFGTGHVFRTVNGGASWTDISGDLPDVPVNAVLSHPALGDELYVGTDLGNFRSVSGGTAWAPFNTGFPNVAVFDLAFSPGTGTIVAATHGRGMFTVRKQLAASVVLTPDAATLASIGETITLTAAAADTAGQPVPGVFVSWRSLESGIAAVDGAGVVTARANGTARIVAAVTGRADTTVVTVRQLVAAVTGLPDTTTAVVGEEIRLSASAVDARGVAVPGNPISWQSSAPAVASVDGTGLVVALAVGTATVSAASLGLRDSVRIAVAPASVMTIDATAVPQPAPVSSAAGSRVELLRLGLLVNGVEPVQLTHVGFDLTGDDVNARIRLVNDLDRDDVADNGEPVVATGSAVLTPGAAARVVLTPTPLLVSEGQPAALLVVLEMSGNAPNGTTFRATFVPSTTRTIGVRSRSLDRVTQPDSPVASADVRSTLLPATRLLTISENPVRSARVRFNFAERPATAGIYTVTGRLVIDFTDGITSDGTLEWDLRNSQGTPVAPGVYLVVFDVGGTVFREKLIVLRGEP